MNFKRDYHQRWYAEINWLLRNSAQQQSYLHLESDTLAFEILREIINSMPSGIGTIDLQRITSCDELDIQALYTIMGLVPHLPYRLSLVDGIAKLFPL